MAADDTRPQSGNAQHPQDLKACLKPGLKVWRTPVVILETVSDLTMSSSQPGNDGAGGFTADLS
jgi:hypothetical protein